MRYSSLFIFCFLTLKPSILSITTACFRQGIKGNVYLVSGNQMPSPDLPPSKPKGLKTTLAIFELTNTSQIKKSGKFYEKPSTKLVELIQTDETGAYKMKLKPGKYSLFIRIDSLYYSNVFDDKFNIHPVEIKKGKWSVDNFTVNYDAVYWARQSFHFTHSCLF